MTHQIQKPTTSNPARIEIHMHKVVKKIVTWEDSAVVELRHCTICGLTWIADRSAA